MPGKVAGMVGQAEANARPVQSARALLTTRLLIVLVFMTVSGAAITPEDPSPATAHAEDPPHHGDTADTVDDMATVDVVIVGCGPAGIQAGLEAQAHGLSHVIIERGPKCAGFFAKYVSASASASGGSGGAC